MVLPFAIGMVQFMGVRFRVLGFRLTGFRYSGVVNVQGLLL